MIFVKKKKNEKMMTFELPMVTFELPMLTFDLPLFFRKRTVLQK